LVYARGFLSGHAISTEEFSEGNVKAGDTNGKYLYLLTDKGILKVGTGFNGSIAGHTYGLYKRFATSAKDLLPRSVWGWVHFAVLEC